MRTILLWIGKRIGTGRNTKETWRRIRPITIGFISLLLTVVVFASAVSYTLNHFFGPMNKRDKTPVLFTISTGASMSDVAQKLKNQGLIHTTFGIKLLADFSSVTSRIQSGEYVLDRSMSAQDILDVITRPTASSRVVTATLIEGMTLEEYAQTLQTGGVIDSADSFLYECRNIQAYTDFYFIPPLSEINNLRYAMEGYLFPDTYEFYVGSSNQTVIKKLLKQLDTVYIAQYTEQAEKLGMTMHQVLTLASIIEKEGRGEDMEKISAVFHNRLARGMRLETDVTVQYALGVKRLVLTAEELKADSPYNTYVNEGLPVGPICNPGKSAIRAALYPDEEIQKGGYLYFTLTDPYTGEVAFSKTYEEHLALKNKYQSVWAAYDKAQGNG